MNTYLDIYKASLVHGHGICCMCNLFCSVPKLVALLSSNYEILVFKSMESTSHSLFAQLLSDVCMELCHNLRRPLALLPGFIV